MKIIKHGTSNNHVTILRKFTCAVCGCEWIAELNECVLIKKPYPPNCYCYCPECNVPSYNYLESVGMEDNLLDILKSGGDLNDVKPI